GPADGIAHYDLTELVTESKPLVFKMLNIFKFRAGFTLSIEVTLGKFDLDGEWYETKAFFTCKNKILKSKDQFETKSLKALEEINSRLETYQSEGSGFTLISCSKFFVNI